MQNSKKEGNDVSHYKSYMQVDNTDQPLRHNLKMILIEVWTGCKLLNNSQVMITAKAMQIYHDLQNSIY